MNEVATLPERDLAVGSEVREIAVVERRSL